MSEAQKRLDLADRFATELALSSKGVILVGSVAHSPEKVIDTADIDLLEIVDD